MSESVRAGRDSGRRWLRGDSHRCPAGRPCGGVGRRSRRTSDTSRAACWMPALARRNTASSATFCGGGWRDGAVGSAQQARRSGLSAAGSAQRGRGPGRQASGGTQARVARVSCMLMHTVRQPEASLPSVARTRAPHPKLAARHAARAAARARLEGHAAPHVHRPQHLRPAQRLRQPGWGSQAAGRRQGSAGRAAGEAWQTGTSRRRAVQARQPGKASPPATRPAAHALTPSASCSPRAALCSFCVPRAKLAAAEPACTAGQACGEGAARLGPMGDRHCSAKQTSAAADACSNVMRTRRPVAAPQRPGAPHLRGLPLQRPQRGRQLGLAPARRQEQALGQRRLLALGALQLGGGALGRGRGATTRSGQVARALLCTTCSDIPACTLHPGA